MDTAGRDTPTIEDAETMRAAQAFAAARGCGANGPPA
jgi:hypothetical protein